MMLLDREGLQNQDAILDLVQGILDHHFAKSKGSGVIDESFVMGYKAGYAKTTPSR